MHISAGRLLFAHGYPRGRRANSGVFSIPEPAGAGQARKIAFKVLILSPDASITAHFLQNAAHSACLSPKIQYAGTLGC